MTVVITEFRSDLREFCRTFFALTPMVVILFRKSGKIRTIFHLGDDKTGSRLGLAFEHGDIFIRKMPQYIRMTQTNLCRKRIFGIKKMIDIGIIKGFLFIGCKIFRSFFYKGIFISSGFSPVAVSQTESRVIFIAVKFVAAQPQLVLPVPIIVNKTESLFSGSIFSFKGFDDQIRTLFHADTQITRCIKTDSGAILQKVIHRIKC